MKFEKLEKKKPFQNTIAIVCGGSSGIGRETSILLTKLGASVCIIAFDNLDSITADLNKEKVNKDQFVESIFCDVTDYYELQVKISNFVEKYGTPDYLFNFVGFAIAQYVEKLTIENFKKNMDINYYGVLNPIHILLPYFRKEKKGYIMNTSSMMGYMGMMGYASYSPTKFAIVGLTESLRHELKPFNIHFSLLFPPDTKTPGFKKENETKPEECVILSEKGKLMLPTDVAKAVIKGVLKHKFNILPGTAKLYKILYRYFPKIFRKVLDHDYKVARKKLGKK